MEGAIVVSVGWYILTCFMVLALLTSGIVTDTDSYTTDLAMMCVGHVSLPFLWLISRLTKGLIQLGRQFSYLSL